VRHLFVAEEHLGPRLVSIHNIRFLIRLADIARERILDGTFDSWAAAWRERYFAKKGEA
jgi:queuine tRNA-ribosyltransferase